MPSALITGGSSGIGAQFARALAAQRYDLTLVARGRDRLERIAAELTARHGIQAEVVCADLSTESGRRLTEDRLAAEPVDMLVNNAGLATAGRFHEAPLELLQQQLDVNVTAMLRLTHVALTSMLARRRGDIINVSSVAGFMSGYEVTYAASKNWVTSFSEGAAAQVRGSGVRVMALCPGWTRTELHQRAGVRRAGPRLLWLDAEYVVAAALADLRRGKVISVPSPQYKVIAAVLNVTPRPVVRMIGQRVTRRQS